jgi:hypothetical protein
MRAYKDFLRFCTSLVLMFALIIMQICSFVNLKVLNGSFYKVTLEKSDYFTLLRKEIDFGFENYSMITSIPEEVFYNSLSNEDIKTLSYKNIDSAENYMKYKNKYVQNKIESVRISENIEKYLIENNISTDEDFKGQISAIVEEAEELISNHTVLFNIAVVEKYPQFEKFRKILFTVYRNQPLSIVAVFFFIGLLALINKRRLRRTFLWVGSSFIPAAIMLLVPSLLAVYFKIPYNLAVDTSYLKVALKDIVLGYINYFIVTGIIYLFIGVTCMWIYTYLSNKAHYKKSVAAD